MEATRAGREQDAWGRNGSAAKLRLPCRHQSVVLLSPTGHLSKLLLERRWRDGAQPQQGSETRAVRSPGLALLDLQSQAPCSSICLSLFKSVTQLFGDPDGGPRGQNIPALFLPLWSALKITQVVAQRSWKKSSILHLHLPPAARRASLKPTLGQEQDESSFLEFISMHEARARCKNPALERIKSWLKWHRSAASSAEDPSIVRKWAGLTGTCHVCKDLYIPPRRDTSWISPGLSHTIQLAPHANQGGLFHKIIPSTQGGTEELGSAACILREASGSTPIS